MMKLTFLGTGTSIGVPEMLCGCPVCMSRDAKDKRLRSSLLIETEESNLLIDCGPDFREQVLRYDVRRIDGVLVTHEHYDHVGGIDDLRPFCADSDVPVYAERMVIEHLMERIPYCFGNNKYPGTPSLKLMEISPDTSFSAGNIDVMPIRVMHGKLPIMGFRIGRMAYITDMKSIPEDEMRHLNDLDVLIVNALHTKEHPTHQNVMQAVGFAERIGAERTFFIHMSHRVGLHAVVDEKLPQSMHFAYDGLQLIV